MGNSEESPGSSGRKGRAYLLLSLIVLIWNTAATARHAFESASPSGLHPVAGSYLPETSTDDSATRDARVGAQQGPITLHQNFLLGKRVDINHATVEEISELPGISDTVAASVVAERERRGGFRSPKDLLSVKGIKEKRLEKILPFLAKMENN